MAEEKDGKSALSELITYMTKLVSDECIPNVPAVFASDTQLLALHTRLLLLREELNALASGQLDRQIADGGCLVDTCKTLQARLRHLVWKNEQFLKGDYQHTLEEFGEVGEAFNKTANVLRGMASQIYAKEEAILNISKALQAEVRRNSEKRIAIVKELKERETVFKYQAQHDLLTGIFNRRAFFALVKEEMQSLKNRRKPCCVAILDIDHFKRVNDIYGHVVGDEVLKHVVRCANTYLRQPSCMARYGGEEFIFFLAEAGVAQSIRIAERIRVGIAELPYALNTQKRIPITVSIGVALVPLGGHEQISELLQNSINQADKALYLAKNKGRNRVEFAVGSLRV